jgi:hypothetical protein
LARSLAFVYSSVWVIAYSADLSSCKAIILDPQGRYIDEDQISIAGISHRYGINDRRLCPVGRVVALTEFAAERMNDRSSRCVAARISTAPQQDNFRVRTLRNSGAFPPGAKQSCGDAHIGGKFRRMDVRFHKLT